MGSEINLFYQFLHQQHFPKTCSKLILILSGKESENRNIPKSRLSYIFCAKQRPTQFSKYGKEKSEILQYVKSMGKHKHPKITGFLSLLHETEIHAIPKTWEKQIPMVRKIMTKHKYSIQRHGFLTYFAWSKNPYNSGNTRKSSFSQ